MMKEYEFILVPDSLIGFLSLLNLYGFTKIHRMPAVKDPYTGTSSVTVYATGTEYMYKKLMEEMNR